MIQEKNKYTKIRFILALASNAFIVYGIFKFFEVLLDVNSNPEISTLYEFLILLVGTILFAINRKWADYISFSIFIFSFGGIVPFRLFYSGCFEEGSFNDCLKMLFFSETTIILLIMISPLIFLTVNFIKIIGKK